MWAKDFVALSKGSFNKISPMFFKCYTVTVYCIHYTQYEQCCTLVNAVIVSVDLNWSLLDFFFGRLLNFSRTCRRWGINRQLNSLKKISL